MLSNRLNTVILLLFFSFLFGQNSATKIVNNQSVDQQKKVEFLIKQASDRQNNSLEARAIAQTAYDLAKSGGNLQQQLSSLLIIVDHSLKLNELDAALLATNAGIKISNDLIKPDIAAVFYNFAGVAYNKKEDFDNALRNYFIALSANRTNGNKKHEAINLYNIGLTYQSIENYALSLKYLWQSLKIQEELKDLVGVANNYIGLGKVYYQTNNLKQANEVLDKGLFNYSQARDSLGIASARSFLGLLNLAQDSLSLAEKNYNLALEIYQNRQNIEGIAANANNLGFLYLKKDQLNEAETAFLRSLDAEKMLNNFDGQALVLNNLTMLLLRKGSLFEAEKMIMQAIELSNKSSILASRQIYQTAGIVYFSKGNYNLGKEMMDKYSSFNDSLCTSLLNKKIATLKNKFRRVEKEKQQFSVIRDLEINRLEKQLYRYRLMLFLLIFSVGSWICVRLFFKIRQKRNL